MQTLNTTKLALQKTLSPFSNKVQHYALPPKWKTPSITPFDGFKNSIDHLEAYKFLMLLKDSLDEVLYRDFSSTLRVTTMHRFAKIKLGTIGNFMELAISFVSHFIGSQKIRKPITSLLYFRKKFGKTLR